MIGMYSVALTLLLVSTCMQGSVAVLNNAAQEDLVTALPGLNFPVNYRQFSGYLDAGNGTFLHYWFVESQGSPSSDPVLLWLNGGPGCSSLDGLLNELGPFHISDDGATLYNNDKTWNSFTNILYLESPACVGFSYNENGDCSASDDSTSQHNHNALRQFFKKFPSYMENEFFVTGESYGGVYVPTLSVRIVDNLDSLPLKFKGFAIGNGLSSFALNDNSLVFFANYHGLLGEILWTELVHHCCDSNIPSRDSCDFSGSLWPVCQDRVRQAMSIVYDSGLNMYNLYSDCLHPSGLHSGYYNASSLSRYHADSHNLFKHSKLLFATLNLDPPCTDSTAMTAYLNNPAVRSALHIPANVGRWDVCNDEVNAKFNRQYKTMAPLYHKLQRAGVRGLVYNGDVDMACNFIGDQWFVESLGLKEVAGRRMWHSGGQVGGFVKQFQGLDLLTVRGSGHMVPQDKPGPSLDMIKAFVLNKPY